MTLNAGLLTNPKKGDMEQKNNFMKNKLGAAIELGSRMSEPVEYYVIEFFQEATPFKKKTYGISYHDSI